MICDNWSTVKQFSDMALILIMGMGWLFMGKNTESYKIPE